MEAREEAAREVRRAITGIEAVRVSGENCSCSTKRILLFFFFICKRSVCKIELVVFLKCECTAHKYIYSFIFAVQ